MSQKSAKHEINSFIQVQYVSLFVIHALFTDVLFTEINQKNASQRQLVD